MNSIKRGLRKYYKAMFKKPFEKGRHLLNMMGNKHRCYICGENFSNFIKYHGGVKKIPQFRLRLDLLDSNRDSFRCPSCNSFDRERHLFMFFDNLSFWDKFIESEVLHFAPEIHLSDRISSFRTRRYIKADYNPQGGDLEKIDATKIPYDDGTFDLVICNHVLEHIRDYPKAMSEIHRVLKVEGTAILQTPYSKVLLNNFEDKGIDTDSLREFFYGERDHYRIFAEKRFLEDLQKTGFSLAIVPNTRFFDRKISEYFGVPYNEDLIQVIKK